MVDYMSFEHSTSILKAKYEGKEVLIVDPKAGTEEIEPRDQDS